jgi:predicted O-methyltransferase YrrM
MTEALQAYLHEETLREPEPFRRLREQTAGMEEASCQIAPEQGQFMALLTRLTGARRAIEIGTFTGYSALWVASAMPEDGQLICCDVSEEWTAIARQFWEECGLGDRIALRIGPAADTLDAMLAAGEAGTYDMVFIDADKPNYDAYYERGLSLLRAGGLILIDNALWRGQVAEAEPADPNAGIMRALNRKVRDDERVEMAMLPVADGLLLAQKRA